MNSVTKLKIVVKVRGGETIERLVHKFEYVMVSHVFSFRIFKEKNIGVEGEKKG